MKFVIYANITSDKNNFTQLLDDVHLLLPIL